MRRIRTRKYRVLITGGPTRAFLDPVRFLSNVSTGGLAYELCRSLVKANIEVAAVIGPSGFPFEELKLHALRRVETNDEMSHEVRRLCRQFKPDVAVFSAAVLDFAPDRMEKAKISSKNTWKIHLKPTSKIIDQVGEQFPKIKRIGFKLESKRLKKEARRSFAKKYLTYKKLQGLCLNFLSDVRADSHKAYLLDAQGNETEAKSKKEIASWIVSQVSNARR